MISETSKFKLFYFIRYIGDSFFYPFMSLYFISKGIGEQQLGIILAITPITTILVNPFWNFIIKDVKMSRFLLKVMTLLEGLFIIIITRVSGFELYALLACLIAFFCSPFISIQDGFTATFADKSKIEYSSLRIYASMAYVIGSGLAGIIISSFGYDLLFLISGFFFAITSLIVFWIKPIEQDLPQSNKLKRNMKSLLKNIDFYKYLFFYTVLIGSVRIGDLFFGVYLVDVKSFPMTYYGFMFAAFVSVEVLTLRYLMHHGNSFQEKNIFLISAGLFGIRYLFYCFDLPVWVLVSVTMIRGVAWGIIIYGSIKYIIKIVRVENVTSAILFITFAFSIYTAIGNILAGNYIELHGYIPFYMILTALIGFSLVFFILFTPKTIDEKQAKITT